MDAFESPYWNIRQVLAWIRRGDPSLVRKAGDSTIRGDAAEAIMDEIIALREYGDGHFTTDIGQTTAAIKKALQDGQLTATGFANGKGDPATIPVENWAYLELCLDPDEAAAPATRKGSGSATRWRTLRFPREKVLAIWPDEQEMDGAASRLVPHAQREATPETGQAVETSPIKKGTRAARKEETLRKYARWNDFALWIKTDNESRSTRQLAAAISRITGENANTIKRRLTEHFPDWAS
jgi:hypothetical protein